MKYRREYMDMNEIGRLFGVSGRVIGARLKKLRLRDRWNPTSEAEAQQLIDCDYERHGTYTKLWHVERTVKILKDTGLELVSPLPTHLVEPPELGGPFSITDAGFDQWQLIGVDGEAAIVVTGESNARAVQRVINIAHRAGMLDKIRAQLA